MLVIRFMSGLPHGAFFGVGTVVASRMAGKGKEAFLYIDDVYRAYGCQSRNGASGHLYRTYVPLEAVLCYCGCYRTFAILFLKCGFPIWESNQNTHLWKN